MLGSSRGTLATRLERLASRVKITKERKRITALYRDFLGEKRWLCSSENVATVKKKGERERGVFVRSRRYFHVPLSKREASFSFARKGHTTESQAPQ